MEFNNAISKTDTVTLVLGNARCTQIFDSSLKFYFTIIPLNFKAILKNTRCLLDFQGTIIDPRLN